MIENLVAAQARPFVSAADLAQNDRAAQAYVARRLRDLQALSQDLSNPDNGYATVRRTKNGVEIQTRTETIAAISYVAAQAYILAKFW